MLNNNNNNNDINDNINDINDDNNDNYDDEEIKSNYSLDSESKRLIYKSSLKSNITETINIKKEKKNNIYISNINDINKPNIKKYNKISNDEFNFTNITKIKRTFNPRLPPFLLIKKNINNINIHNNDINFPKL